MTILTRDELVVAIVYLTVAKLMYTSLNNEFKELKPEDQELVNMARELKPGYIEMILAILVAVWPAMFIFGILKVLCTPIPPSESE